MKSIRRLLRLACLLSLACWGWADPPTNDAYEHRLPLGGDDIYEVVNNAEATVEKGEPRHAGQDPQHSVWWVWTPPDDGYGVMDTTNSGFATRVAIYENKKKLGELEGSSPARLTLSGIPATPDHYEFEVRKNSKYDLVVDGMGGATGDILLQLKLHRTPLITVPPEDLRVTEGQPAKFAVRGIGLLPLSYQWQFRDLNLGPFVEVPGATGAEYEIRATRPQDEGWYRVRLRNAAGSVMSDPPVYLTVIRAPTVTPQPKSAAVYVGETTNFTSGAIGGEPMSYQWQFKPEAHPSWDWSDLPGEVFTTLTLGNLSTDEAGMYRMWARNDAGEAVSSNATLTVTARPPQLLTQPQDLVRIVGEEACFSTSASGYQPIDYYWWFRPTAGGPARFIPGGFGTTVCLYDLKLSDHGRYWAVVSNRYGLTNTREALLTVEARPPNDDFEKRFAILPPDNWTNSFLVRSNGWNRNGTWQDGEPKHENQTPQHSVWWGFTAPEGGMVSVSASSPDFPAVLGVYTGPAVNQLVRVVTTNNAGFKTFLATNAAEYLFAVDGADGKFGSNIVVTLRFNTKLDAPIFIVEPVGFFGFFGGFLEGDGDGGCEDYTFTTLALSLDGFVRYQWQYRPSPAAPFNDLVGQTRPTLTLKEVTAELAGDYQVIAYNSQNTATTSRVATLTVNVGPGIPEHGHPTNIVAEACATVTNRVIAQGCGDLHYQWRHNDVPLPGQTAPEIILRDLTPLDAGRYDVIVSNRNAAVTSRVAQVTVTVNPVITKQPQPQSVTDCGEARFEVEARARCPLAYQWRIEQTPIPDATNRTLVLSRPIPFDEGLYDVVVRTDWGAVTSQVARLTVKAGPSIARLTFNTQQVKAPPNHTTTVRDCAPVYLEVQPNFSCTPLRFQWRKEGGPLRGETNAFLSFTGSLETAGEYTVELNNDWESVVSNPIGVAVDTRPLVESQPRLLLESQRQYGRLLAGEDFTLTVQVASCSALTYHWQFRPTETGEFEDFVLDPLRHTVGTNGWLTVEDAKTGETGYYRVIASNAYTSVTSEAARVRVLVRPPNDNFVNRIFLGQTNTASVVGFNEMGTAEVGEPHHAYQPPSHSIWYSWTAPQACLATVDLSASDFDTVLGVYTGGAVSNLVSVTFDDNGGPNRRSKVSFLAGRDRTFAFAIDGKGGAESTNVVVAVTTEPFAVSPQITQQPDNIARTNGQTAEFVVRAYGSPDITVQWLSNNVPILGATNITLIGLTNAETATVYGLTNYEARLVLPNVQTNFEANYRALLCNEFGCTNTRIARLTFGSIIKGMVTDAISGLGIPDATVSVGLVSTNTDEFGNYELVGVRLGELRAEFFAEKQRVRLNEVVQFRDRSTATAVQFTATKDGYYQYVDDQFEVGKGQTVAKVFSMSPVFEGLRFVLNWGIEPDLDFYLSLPPIPGLTNDLIWYPEEAHGSLGPPTYAELEYDTNRFGPETITISRVQAGTYSLYVEKFGHTAGELTASGAKVFAYFGGSQTNNLYGFVEVPTLGTNPVWHVCDVEGPWTNITWINELVDLPPRGQPHPVSLLSLEAVEGTGARRSVRLQTLPKVETGSAYEWDFGDGLPHTEVHRRQEPTNAYPHPGWYDIRLTITQTNPATGKTTTEFKPRYILVTNTPPVIAITNPPSGWIVRGGDPLLLEAEAHDVDDPLTRVDFFEIVGGATNFLGGVTRPPYAHRLTDVPYENTHFTFTARATDSHNGTAWAEPVIVRVRDLRGDVLVVRNREHPEVEGLTNTLWLTVTDSKWPEMVWPPFETRVLDQEGLHWDLVKGFRVIIWHDPGDPEAGVSDASPRLTTNDVKVFYDAYQAGISLYFIGERLARAAERMDYPYDLEWRWMTQLTTNSLAHFTNAMITFTNRFSNHPLLDRYAGTVPDFRYPGVLESAVRTGAGAEIVGLAQGAHPLLASPPLDQPDFGVARAVTQGFLVTSGGESLEDLQSKDARQALFVNSVMWLLRLECDNFRPQILCLEEAEESTTGEPLTFQALTSNNGRCAMNGVIVTNYLPRHMRLVTSSRFVPGDLTDLPSLARKLKQATNELALYLSGRLSPPTRQALATYRGAVSEPGVLDQLLLADLNDIINGPCLYEQNRFAGVELRPDTRQLLDPPATGSSLVRLNRQLLEDAYRTEILRDRLVEAGGFAWFTSGTETLPGDLHSRDLPALAERLKRQSDPVSQYIVSHFSEATRWLLEQYRGPDSDPGPLLAALIEEFNLLIQGECIYESNRFAGVRLPPQTARRLLNEPQGDALTHLNRLLLEAAYPEALTQSAALVPTELGGWPDQPDAIVLCVGRLNPGQEGRIYSRMVPLLCGNATNRFAIGVNGWRNAPGAIACEQVVFVQPCQCETPPLLSAMLLTDRRLSLTIQGTAGCHYDLQSAASLTRPVTWSSLTNLATTTGITEVLLPPPQGAGQRLYRVVVIP